jgi:GNAT superfamily N-acetyltransferase
MTQDLLIESDLARRVEAIGVSDLARYVDEARVSAIYPEATTFRVGGGGAFWYSRGNIVNSAFGLGMNGPVEREEIAALIEFFAERGEQARIDVCPYTDASLLRWLATYGFVATGFETVLLQRLGDASDVLSEEPGPVRWGGPSVTVHQASSAGDRELWAELEARGFKEDVLTEEDMVLARAIALRRDAVHLIGSVDGQPAGTGMLVIDEGAAMLNGDATLPAFRNKGVQTALLHARLRLAAEAGCDLAVIEASPGGTSERNQQRAGFRVAYTRVTMELPRRD